ncbi:MAG: site-specific integrase [Deltaproteobacteria bacterium]|nr:site-specific integrase [Deltaproteobacteria bacterium]
MSENMLIRIRFIDLIQTLPDLKVSDSLYEACQISVMERTKLVAGKRKMELVGYAAPLLQQLTDELASLILEQYPFRSGSSGIIKKLQSSEDISMEEIQQLEESISPETPTPDALNKLSDNQKIILCTKVFAKWSVRRQLNQSNSAQPIQTVGVTQLVSNLQQPPLEPTPDADTLFKKYTMEQRSTGEWNQKTSLQKNGHFDNLIFIIKNLPVDEYTKGHAQDYRKILLKLPANRKKKFENISFQTLIKDYDFKTMAPSTFNKHVETIQAFFEWCSDRGHINNNPFNKLKLKISKQKQKTQKRRSFTPEEIAQIFSPKDYLPQSITQKTPKVFRFWGPLVLLFSGLRVNELCQIHLDDISEKDGIWLMNINGEIKEEGSTKDAKPEEMLIHKHLKCTSAERIVPIHPTLRLLGFHDFIESQRKNKGQIKLFHDLKWTVGNRHIRKLSFWFNNDYLRNTLKMSQGTKVLYATRHTFSQRLKNLGIGDGIRYELMGHEHDVTTDKVYTNGYEDFKIPFEAIRKIEFPIDVEGLTLNWKKPKTIPDQIKEKLKTLS